MYHHHYHHHHPHSTGARETISRSEDERGFIGIFYVHYEKVSSLHECFFIQNIISQIYRTACITEYNYTSSNLPDKSTDSGIVISSDDKNSDTGGKITVIPWLASYEISKPEVNKTVTNTQLSIET